MTPTARRLSASGGALLGATVLAFGVGAPPERCPDVTVDEARAATSAAVGWIVDNQAPDGTWLYEYDAATDTTIDDYNVVRHAGVMMSLYQAAARGYDGALESADRGLAWALERTVERHGWVAVADAPSIRAGTNALLIAGLAERRESTGETTYDGLMAGLATFLVDQTEPNGALLGYYDLGPDRPRSGAYSPFFTGEAQWALARMHLAFPDDGWGAVADRMLHYMATERDRAEGIWPPLADHWAGYGLAATAAFADRPTGEPLTDAELEFARRQAGLMGQRVRAISQLFGPWGVVVRGTFEPRGGAYGVFGEGLAGLFAAAQLDDRLEPERAVLAERATCIVGLAIDAQITTSDAAAAPDPTKLAGAWLVDDTTRMDDQQHAVSALMLTIPILELSPDTIPDSIHPVPMWLLWFVVVVATINPARVALGAPRTATPRLVATGTAAGAVGLLAVGALSGGVLDLLDVSRPSMRLAAAALCLLSAAIDFVRPTPEIPRDVAAGGSAFAPIAVPLTFRSAVVIAGLSVVADHGLALYAASLVTTVAASVIVAAWATSPEPAPDRPPRLVVGAARALAATAFAASALLVAHAVFDL